MSKIRHSSTKNKHRMIHWLNPSLCGNEHYGAAWRVVYAGLFVRDRVGHKEHTMMRARWRRKRNGPPASRRAARAGYIATRSTQIKLWVRLARLPRS